MEAKRTVKMVISIDVETTKSVEEIKKALERGIYRELKYLSSTISKACAINTNNNSAYGFYWSYNEDSSNFYGIGQENNKLQVQQFSLEGELIKTWSSISIAAKETNSSKSSIIRCCKNKQKICNNFIWKYLNN